MHLYPDEFTFHLVLIQLKHCVCSHKHVMSKYMHRRGKGGVVALPGSRLMPLFFGKISVRLYEKASWPACRDPGLNCQDLGKLG